MSTSTETVPGMAEAIERRLVSEALSPTEFETRSGLTGPGLAPVRKGLRRNYSAKTRYGVARALRWPLDWYEQLLDGADPDAFPDVEHQGQGSVEERLSALEHQVHELVRLIAGD